jgi:hypothetical protein
MEREKIKFGIASTFHMLRHFQTIDSEDVVKLRNAAYTHVQIEDELKVYGSKFDPSFAIKISTLLDKIEIDKFEHSISINGNTQLLFRESYNNTIGTLSVLPVSELNPNQRKKIFFQENRGYNLQHIKVDTLPRTNQWTMILKPQSNNEFYFVTAFPGKPALPIPSDEMSSIVKNACIDFWKEHVFLVL